LATEPTRVVKMSNPARPITD